MNHGRTYRGYFGGVSPWLRLVRVFQCSVAGLLGIEGYEVQAAPSLILSVDLCYVFAFIFLACASANIINDIRDIHADSIQHPTRPLPSGRINKSTAWAVFIATAGSSVGFSSLFGPAVIVVTSSAIFLGILYSMHLKSTVLLGNATVACTAMMALPAGAIAHGTPPTEVFLAYGLLTLFMFAFEILKTLRDREGDDAAGCRTIAVVCGERPSISVLRACMACLTIVSLSLALFHSAWLWALTLFVSAVLPSTVLVYRLPLTPTSEAIVLTLRGMRIAWIPGVVTIGIWLWHAQVP